MVEKGQYYSLLSLCPNSQLIINKLYLSFYQGLNITLKYQLTRWSPQSICVRRVKNGDYVKLVFSSNYLHHIFSSKIPQMTLFEGHLLGYFMKKKNFNDPNYLIFRSLFRYYLCKKLDKLENVLISNCVIQIQ